MPAESPAKHVFERLVQALAFFGLTAEYLPIRPERAFEGLRLQAPIPHLPADQLEIQLAFGNDALLAFDPGLAALREQAQNLLFVAVLPLQAPAARRAELSGLLLSLNHTLPFGAFGFDGEGQILFRYQLLAPSREVPPLLVVRIIRLIQLYTGLFLPILRKLAQAELSLSAALGQAEARLRTLAE